MEQQQNRAIDRLITFYNWCREQGIVKNNTEFEKMCGLGRSYLYNMENNSKGSIGSDALEGVKRALPMINLEWVIMGEGEMLTYVPTGGYKTAFNKQKEIAREAMSDLEDLYKKLEKLSRLS